MIVNRSCPLEQISRSELGAVYSGTITRWAPLGWKGGGEVIAMTAGPRLGMHEYLRQALLGGAPYAPTVYAPATDGIVERGVAHHATGAFGHSPMPRPVLSGAGEGFRPCR